MLIVAPAGVTQRYRRVSIRVRREAEFTTQRREVEQRARAASINVFHDMTTVEVDAALRQRELFGAAEYPVQRVDAAERTGATTSMSVDGSGTW